MGELANRMRFTSGATDAGPRFGLSVFGFSGLGPLVRAMPLSGETSVQWNYFCQTLTADCEAADPE